MIKTSVKPAQTISRGVIMEHHLEFWHRFRLLRGRNRWSRRGRRWNLDRIIAEPQHTKSAFFESCWSLKSCDLPRPAVIQSTEKPNGISREPCIIGLVQRVKVHLSRRHKNGYHHNSQCRNHPQIAG